MGAYGAANPESGFAVKDVGLDPDKYPPHIEYSKIVGKHFVDKMSGEHYSALAIKHEGSNRDFVILFQASKSRNILTSENERKYGGDTLLVPIALISWMDLRRLHSGELKIKDIRPSDFPKGCKLGTSLRTGMSLTHTYFSYPKCRSETSGMSINGKIKSSFGHLRVDLIIRVGKDEFWFGEKGQAGRRYSKFGSGIRVPEKRN